MSIKKFKPKDILLNTMKAHPRCEFFIFDSKIYYNNIPEQSGAFSANVRNVQPGHISLYEYNIDKITGSSDSDSPSGDNPFIYPFITKDTAGASFRSVTSSGGLNEWTTASVGDILYGSYPMSASISREYMNKAGDRNMGTKPTGESSPFSHGTKRWEDSPKYRHYWALRNRLNFYGIRSKHYVVSSSLEDGFNVDDAIGWDKDNQKIGMISIPSIFFGSKIRPGSLSLKWYFTGSLCGELRDTKRNGELIQVSGGVHADSYNDKVAGVVLYDEGFILLTGSWPLQPETIKMKTDGLNAKPQWQFFGAGAGDGVNTTSAGSTFVSCSFNLSFEGTTETQVMTMFAHARRGEANYSNNPTFLLYGQEQLRITSSQIYEESSDRLLANVVSSSFMNHSASFKRQVYISKVAIYDDKKNLIGIATMANPVLKQEDQDYTFKLRLDI
jgi:hypothetical protein